jgi:hypothetical protein
VPQGPPPTHRQVSRAGDIQIELFSTFHAAAEHFTRVIFHFSGRRDFGSFEQPEPNEFRF